MFRSSLSLGPPLCSGLPHYRSSLLHSADAEEKNTLGISQFYTSQSNYQGLSTSPLKIDHVTVRNMGTKKGPTFYSRPLILLELNLITLLVDHDSFRFGHSVFSSYLQEINS